MSFCLINHPDTHSRVMLGIQHIHYAYILVCCCKGWCNIIICSRQSNISIGGGNLLIFIYIHPTGLRIMAQTDIVLDSRIFITGIKRTTDVTITCVLRFNSR